MVKGKFCKSLPYYNFYLMGAQCVRPCLREASPYGAKQPSSPYRLRGKDGKLHFVLTISNLELHCPPQVLSCSIGSKLRISLLRSRSASRSASKRKNSLFMNPWSRYFPSKAVHKSQGNHFRRPGQKTLVPWFRCVFWQRQGRCRGGHIPQTPCSLRRPPTPRSSTQGNEGKDHLQLRNQSSCLFGVLLFSLLCFDASEEKSWARIWFSHGADHSWPWGFFWWG